MESNLFLHLNTENLSQYFSKGLIIPSKYIEGWSYDVQSKYRNSLLLCSNALINNTQCSLEIVLTKGERIKLIKISDEFFVFPAPLPISRIKKILFSDKTQGENTIYNIEEGDAFVPKDIVEYHREFKQIDYPELNKIKDITSSDWSIKNKLYNQILGGFALMKIGNYKKFKKYSDNYFNYVAYINKEVEEQTKAHKSKFDSDNYINILDIKNDQPESKVFEQITEDFVANKSKGKLPTNSWGQIKVAEVKDPNIYILSVLATYGNDMGKTKKIDDFIYSIKNQDFREKTIERLCLTFGINQGYSSFKSEYKFNDETIGIKFKLDSELDYSILESIYQYVFNGQRENYSFDYINSWCPKSNNKVNLDNFETFQVFDKTIILEEKSKTESKDYLQELLNIFSSNNVVSPLFKMLSDSVKTGIKNAIGQGFNKVQKDMEEELKLLKSENEKLTTQLNKVEKEKEELYSKLNSSKDVVKPNKFQRNDDIPLIVKNIEIENRSIQLEKLKTLSGLKAIAKYIGVKNITKYKKDDLDSLRRAIIEKENDILN